MKCAWPKIVELASGKFSCSKLAVVNCPMVSWSWLTGQGESTVSCPMANWLWWVGRDKLPAVNCSILSHGTFCIFWAIKTCCHQLLLLSPESVNNHVRKLPLSEQKHCTLIISVDHTEIHIAISICKKHCFCSIVLLYCLIDQIFMIINYHHKKEWYQIFGRTSVITEM